MKRPPKILLVGTPHGNERLGPRLRRYLTRHEPRLLAQVDYLCGNPKAFRQNVRYIESDFNRSFGAAEPLTYEQRRARKVLERIEAGGYDYVLDLHTTVAKTDRFFLAAKLTLPVRQIVGASRLQRVVVMPPHIADCSLIGNVPQAISIEYNHMVAKTPQAIEELMEILHNLLQGAQQAIPREFYYVKDKISLDAPLEKEAANFVQSRLGYYPVLLDEGSYGTYRGFAAPHRERVQL